MHESFDNRIAYYLYSKSAKKALGYDLGTYLGGRALRLDNGENDLKMAPSSARISIEQLFSPTQKLRPTNAFRPTLDQGSSRSVFTFSYTTAYQLLYQLALLLRICDI